MEKMNKKLMKRIDEVVRTQKYDEKLVVTLLEISNTARTLAEKMLLFKHMNEKTK